MSYVRLALQQDGRYHPKFKRKLFQWLCKVLPLLRVLFEFKKTLLMINRHFLSIVCSLSSLSHNFLLIKDRNLKFCAAGIGDSTKNKLKATRLGIWRNSYCSVLKTHKSHIRNTQDSFSPTTAVIFNAASVVNCTT